MSLNINKRLRYFNTEAEYLAYVEAQRAAAEAGTLELMETTVCCIKHNDDTTPDEYHPSTEAGYTDVVFNYNENDDIRYVPFINPMWTSRLCTVYPIKDSEGTVVGYKPVLYQNAELPDVIDGQQFTEIDTEFTRKLLSRWPAFSVTNVESLEYQVNSNFVGRLNLPSLWPNLITASITGYEVNNISTFPIFGNNNTLDAPELTDFTVSSQTAILSIENFPRITSNKLESFNASFSSGSYFNRDVPMNFDNVILDSSSLTSLNLSFYNSESNDYIRVPLIQLTHTGPSLSVPNIYLSHAVNDSTKKVELNITTNAGIVNCNSLILCCDFNNSTCTCPLNVKELTIRNCSSTASTNKTWGNYITHKNDSIRISFPQMYYFYEDNSEFNNIIVDLPEGIPIPQSRREYYVSAKTDTLGKTLTINMPNSSAYSFNIVGGNTSTPLDTLIINLPSVTPYKFEWLSTVKMVASNLIINGEWWATSVPYMYSGYTINNKAILRGWGKDGAQYQMSLDSTQAKYFHLYCNSIYVNIDSAISPTIEITLCKAPQSIPVSSYYTFGSLRIRVNADISSLIVHSETQDYSLNHVDVTMENSNVSLNTIKAVLDAVNDVKTSFPAVLTYSGSIIRILRVFYNQLPTSYLDIVNSFYTINIIE